MKKILIIRFSSIGDIVLTTPVIRCLKKQIECEIHFLTKTNYATVLEANPYLSKIIKIEKDVAEVIDELKKENYSHIVDLHNNLRSASVKRKLNASASSFPKLNIQKWLLVNFKINRLPDVHIVDRYLSAVHSLGVKNDNEGLDYFIPENQNILLSSLPQFLQNGYVLFAIGAQHSTKRLPAEKIIAICRQLKYPIILAGGKEDVETAEKITASAPLKIYNACGKYSIHQSASLVKQANVVITHDTGLMHIAAAFKKKIISVWGNTIPGFGMYPYLPQQAPAAIIEVKGLKCRPCSKIGFEKCPRTHFNCMHMINENEIVDLAEQGF